MENKKILSEEALHAVSGSCTDTRERTLGVKVKFPALDAVSMLTVYVDGLLEPSMETDIYPGTIEKVFYFKGTRGYKHVVFKLNNLPYACYDLDFDHLIIHATT